MRLRLIAPAHVVLAMLGASACSLLADYDGLTDPPPGANGSSDGGTDLRDGAASDATLDGPGDLVVFDGFETAKAACGWLVDEGTAVPAGTSPEPVARSGSGACVICSSGGRIRIDRNFPEARAGSYQVTAYVRQVPDASAPDKWTARVIASIDGGTVAESAEGTLDQTYRVAQATLMTKADANKVFVRLGSERPVDAGVCIVVDDVTMTWSAAR